MNKKPMTPINSVKALTFDVFGTVVDWRSGISEEGDLLDLAIEDNIVNKSGAWFSYRDVRMGQGRENARQFLVDNREACDEIREAILAKRAPAPETDKDEPAKGKAESKKSAKLTVAKRKRA